MNKETITKYSQLALLISICVVLIFWRHIQLLIPNLTIEQILGSFVAILSSMFLYFDSRLSAAIRGPVRPITHMNLTECFNQISKQCKHVKHMRIYAISTGRIKPIFSSSDIRVEKCDILLRDFSATELENVENVRRQRQINDIICAWEIEKSKGRVKELSIRLVHK